MEQRKIKKENGIYEVLKRDRYTEKKEFNKHGCKYEIRGLASLLEAHHLNFEFLMDEAIRSDLETYIDRLKQRNENRRQRLKDVLQSIEIIQN